MSLGSYKSDSPGPARLPSPSSYGEWISKDFTDDLLLDSSFDQPLNLTAEEERLFRSFGDGLGDSLGCSLDSLSDPINERQVVFAEAQAAGLFKGGIRRAAFSMGDLQALQPPEPPSPRSQAPRPPVSSAGASKAPRLESVPESKALPTTSALLGDSMLLNSRLSGLSTGGMSSAGGLGDGLDGLVLDQLSADLLGGAGSSSYDADVPMPMFDENHPAREGAMSMGLSMPMIKLEPDSALGMPPLPKPRSGSQTYEAHNSTQGLYDYPFINSSTDRKPPLPPSTAGFSSPLVNPDSTASLRSYADELLGSTGTSTQPTTSSPTQTKKESKEDRRDREQQQRECMLRRSQSALELRSMGGSLPRHGSTGDLQQRQFMVELTTPEGHTYTAGRLSNEERAQKILRYRQKRHERNFNKRIKYMCRKTLADSRPRVRGRFARNDDAAAVMPHETKKALAEKARKEKKANQATAVASPQHLLEGTDFHGEFSALIPVIGGQPFDHGSAFSSSEVFSFPPVPSGYYSSRPQSRGGPPMADFQPGPRARQ